MAPGRSAGRAKFDVWPTPVASEDLAKLRGDVDGSALAAIQRLKHQGCKAARNRLSGAAVERVCAVVLPRNWRMLIAFPAVDEIAILLVGPHDETNPDTNIYSRLFRTLGIDVPDDERRKPPCCDEDDRPPVSPDLVDRFLEQARALAKRERRQHRGGQR